MKKPVHINIKDSVRAGIEDPRFGGKAYILSDREAGEDGYLTAKDARKLAIWLLNAAEYMERNK